MAERHAPVRLKATITTGAAAPAQALAATPDQATTTQPRHRKARVNFDDLPRSAYVRVADLIPDVLPLSKATFWRKVKDGTMVQTTKLSGRVTALNVGAIRDWLQAQAQGEAA
jgi:prophage regulatory protein